MEKNTYLGGLVAKCRLISLTFVISLFIVTTSCEKSNTNNESNEDKAPQYISPDLKIDKTFEKITVSGSIYLVCKIERTHGLNKIWGERNNKRITFNYYLDNTPDKSFEKKLYIDIKHLSAGNNTVKVFLEDSLKKLISDSINLNVEKTVFSKFKLPVDNNLIDFYIDKKNRKWFFVRGYYPKAYLYENKQLSEISTTYNTQGKIDFQGMTESDNGTIYLLAHSSLLKYEGSKWKTLAKFKPYNYSPYKRSKLIFFKNSIYLWNLDRMLFKYNIDNSKIDTIFNLSEYGNLSDNKLYSFELDEQGKVYLLTSYGVISNFSGNWKHYKIRPEENNKIFSYSSDYSIGLKSDKQGSIWTGAKGKLFKFSKGSWEEISFGLHSENVYGIEIISNTNIWFSTYEYLYHYKDEQLFKHYYRDFGAYEAVHTIRKAENGEVWVAWFKGGYGFKAGIEILK